MKYVHLAISGLLIGALVSWWGASSAWAQVPKDSSKQPTGDWIFLSDSIAGTRTRMEGESIVLPRDGSYRIYGYWYYDPITRDTPIDSVVHWFDAPLTITADGRIATLWSSPLVGHWDSSNEFELLPAAAMTNALGPWSILRFTRLAILESPTGVYAVTGASGVNVWSGTIGIVRTPLVNKTTKNILASILLNVQGVDGFSAHCSSTIDLPESGYFSRVLNCPQKTSVYGRVGVGHIDISFDITLPSMTYVKHVEMHGERID